MAQGSRIVVLVLVALLLSISVLHVRLSARIFRLEQKASKFDDYCQAVRATAAVVATDLANERWRPDALERFSARVGDLNRCATRTLSWDRFADCKLRGDQACIALFVRDARDAIPVAP